MDPFKHPLFGSEVQRRVSIVIFNARVGAVAESNFLSSPLARFPICPFLLQFYMWINVILLPSKKRKDLGLFAALQGPFFFFSYFSKTWENENTKIFKKKLSENVQCRTNKIFVFAVCNLFDT